MLMERILSRENLLNALKRVERNGGSHGVDKMSTQYLRSYIVEHWDELRKSLQQGTYEPQPVRRVEIPKPNGGVRLLGIPTVIDRFIQQAITQTLTPIYDPTFSENSYGFRPQRRGHDAVRKAKRYIEDGYRWVVDIDLEKFFDKVNHDKLMGLLSKRIDDKVLLNLVRKYLNVGIMMGGVVSQNTEGTPQGGPLSPLLSNIILDLLDKELENRGHKFVRYADDCNIYVKSKKAGLRTMAGVTSFIEKKLSLKVNREKSAVDRPWNRKFLGFSFTNRKEPKIRISKQSIKRFKQKVREITSRKSPIPMDVRIKKLNQYLVGWCGYYALADTPSIFKGLESWIRRRLRLCYWKQWKLPKTRIRKLIGLGIDKHKAYEWGNSRKGYWRITSSPILHRALNNSFWRKEGLKSLSERYETLRHT
ncbi:group II intron reverse transcriptase/maturase [Metabacillus elymi]|uniref:RNA-directed DNA polymerase n=1 Tax=Metabacillus elymi TaxID=2745198 RepID=A0ABX6S4V0_9BACI|nr:group II intron reverse transcriptase/maturase [Metabacillus sp. KUDC1714]QNF26977.1 group II intron reverse transcriptase/maturase [Metabacillus sp. KUDC1714]QNF29064.1 group II intron reverse transcriptase/maturase [Metabacillus sp. KUDC1714]